MGLKLSMGGGSQRSRSLELVTILPVEWAESGRPVQVFRIVRVTWLCCTKGTRAPRNAASLPGRRLAGACSR